MGWSGCRGIGGASGARRGVRCRGHQWAGRGIGHQGFGRGVGHKGCIRGQQGM